MEYRATASIEHRESLTPANSPSKDVWGEWQREIQEFEATSYLDLVSKLSKFMDEYPAGTFDIEKATTEKGGKFSNAALAKLGDDVQNYSDKKKDAKFSFKSLAAAIIILFFTFYGLKTFDKAYFEHKQYLARQDQKTVIMDYGHEVYQLSSLEHYGR